jgi:NAD dependent epimerase/dehydratase family
MSATRGAALIGHTGFVGGNLLAQHSFDARYNSSNIDEIAGQSFDLIVCAGAPAEKWKANADPERDLANIQRLAGAIIRANARRVVLLSTVDVFGSPIGVDEDSPVPTDGLHAYGRNRRLLEESIAARFETTVVRLPALYGPGLKKNVIFDFLHDNDVHKIDSRGVFQFYDTTRLWRDIDVAMRHRLPLVHLPTEPVSVGEVIHAAFGVEFDNHTLAAPARYDVRTRHAALFGGSGAYIESASQTLAGIAAFVARERAKAP